ncbi:MAG TPA: carboxypeptidase regulatory-like domain-containing protein [Gemmatimonadaceae bacterium]
MRKTIGAANSNSIRTLWSHAHCDARIVAIGLLPLCFSLLLPLPASAQPSPLPAAGAALAQLPLRTSSVRGKVRDSADNPIPYATVVWGDAQQSISTSDSGSFELVDIPAGKTRFSVRRVGFAPANFDLILKPGMIKPVVVNLIPVVATLSEVAIEARGNLEPDSYREDRFRATGFYDRKAHTAGYFIPPEEVERRRPTYISDLMYNVPGVTMVGKTHSGSLRYVSSAEHCRLQLYLDGHPAQDGDDLVTGSDIKAVEVYTSLITTSPAFMPSPLKGYCGSIIVWTK